MFDPGENNLGAGAMRDRLVERIVAVQNHGPVAPDHFGEGAFFLRDRLPRTHELDVRDADVGDDAEIRRGQGGEGGDLAGVIHSQLPNCDFVSRSRLEHRPRQPDVIVEIAFGFRDTKTTRECGRDKILGAGLAVAAGDRDDPQREGSPIAGCDLLVADERVGYANKREIIRHLSAPALFDEGAGRAACRRFFDETVAIEILAPDGNEKIARLDRPRVGADASDLPVGFTLHKFAAGVAGDLGKWERVHFA